MLEISLVQKVYHSNGSNYFYAIMDFHDVVVVKPYNIGVPLHDRFSLSKFSNYICNFVHSTNKFACWFLDNIRKLHKKEDYMFNQFYSPLKKYKNWNRKYRKKKNNQIHLSIIILFKSDQKIKIQFVLYINM